jgi:predicted aconitase
MDLTREEQDILDGEEGEGRRKAMEILYALGRIFEADRLIPVASAQVSGVSFKTIKDPGLDFVREFSTSAKVTVPTTLNPAGMDLTRWREMGIDEKFARKQKDIIDAYARMGITISCSCTPYLDVNIPKRGQHLAWAESSAVCFVNSYIGARTNREAGPSALAAAIIGKTPNFKLHTDEGRMANLLVEVEPGITDYATLGYHVGTLKGEWIPYYRGIKPDQDGIKTMAAAQAASGSIALFHVEGVTPEAELALASTEIEKVPVSMNDIETTADKLTEVDQGIELVAIGCPHASPSELRRIAGFLENHEPKVGGPRLWVCTSRESAEKEKGSVEIIERFGLVLKDTCMVVTPIEEIFHRTATNSAKAAHYLSMDKFGNQKVLYGGLERVLSLVLQGGGQDG